MLCFFVYRVEELVEHTNEQERELPILTPSTMEHNVLERIRISNLTITPINDRSHLLIEWELDPLMDDEHINDEDRRKNLRRYNITGFKISVNAPIYKMSQLIDVLQRNYTTDYIEEGKICLLLLRLVDYDKFCKDIPFFATNLPSQTMRSSLIIDSKSTQSIWHLNDPTKTILIGSMCGILLVLLILVFMILLITRCPYISIYHLRTTRYQNNDSKSETLLVRPTPTNTIPWTPPSVPLTATQQRFYHHHHLHHHSTRPTSYQPSISTQCTCPTNYHSSGSSATDTSSSSHQGQNYHIYQEILNDDYNLQAIANSYRTCRPLHIDTNSPPTSTSSNTTMTTSANIEQCQLCSLSVLV